MKTILVASSKGGVGKTTIARLLADATDLAFVQISAIFSGAAGRPLVAASQASPIRLSVSGPSGVL